MIRPAFSTTACPDWTLDRAANAAARMGYAGVELRSFGAGCTTMACDPALSDGAKVQRVFDEAGVYAVGVATGVALDAPVKPPVVGHLLPQSEAQVRMAEHLVDVAVDAQASYVRVYGYEAPKRGRRISAINRIASRLKQVCDAARNRDVHVLLENGGSFSRAEDLVEIVDRVRVPWLGVAYDIGAAVAAGDDVTEGVNLLSARLAAARIRDRREDGTPCQLGEGTLPCAEFIGALMGNTHTRDSVVVFQWDRLWMPELADAETVLPDACRRIYEWAGADGDVRRGVAA
jgi:sugar phosphate isomerase/epimerase